MSKIIIVGYSGHSYSVIDSFLNNGKNKLYGYTEIFKKKNNPFLLNFLGDEKKHITPLYDNYKYILGVGSNIKRRKIFKSLLKNNKEILTVIDSNSFVSCKSEID